MILILATVLSLRHDEGDTTLSEVHGDGMSLAPPLDVPPAQGEGNCADPQQTGARCPDVKVRYAFVPEFGYTYGFIQPSFASCRDAFSRTTGTQSATLRRRAFRWIGTTNRAPRWCAGFSLRTRHARISLCHGGQLGLPRYSTALRIGICRSYICWNASLDTLEHHSHARRRGGEDRRR